MLSPLESVKQLRASHPYIMVGVLALIMFFVITQLSAIVSLVFALAFPLLIVFAHASFRLRDTSAKVNYHLENVKLRNTVMFTLLNGLGLHERA
uniref:PRA1 family protein n=1 Tax=Ditylenchus dipsaci TaxID=166011 RepID=A0A915EEJ5_9BILA